MEAIQGVTPEMLWNFGYTIVGIIAIIVCIEKVPDIIWKWKDRRKKAQEEPQADFADKICDRIMAKLEPKFRDIDDKLKADKARLDSHEYTLSGIHRTQTDISEGFSVLCFAMIAVLNHGIHNGNGAEMEDALSKLHAYLTKRNVDE